jgi:transposase
MITLPEVLARRPDLAALAAQGPAALIGRILELEQEVAAAQRRRVPIGDSRTTHAPPSSDPRPKPRSQRRKSQRRPGGQPGHPGHRLEPTPTPDRIERHAVDRCGACDLDLREQPVLQVRKHQVFDLPPTPLVVTEHQMEAKRCPRCAAVTQAPPPPGAEQPTQYGPRLAAFVIYLHSAHFLPLQRITELLAQMTGHLLSEAWIKTCQARLSARLDSFIFAVIEALHAAQAVCCDETGFRFLGRRFWLHVCCTATLTLLGCHRRRGAEGIDALGILPTYPGIAVHDHWPPYFKSSCQHAVCNEHHIRELAAVSEAAGQTWALEMQKVLYAALEVKRRYHGAGQPIPPDQIATLTSRYEACLQAGYTANPEPPTLGPPKRGRRRRGKILSLLDRLRDRQRETLRCLHDPQVPWCNNQAERDLRPMKGQQKISGGFRTEQGAIDFCRIRSYLSTLQKNHLNLFDGIVQALAGQPWLPSPQPSAARAKTPSAPQQEKRAA